MGLKPIVNGAQHSIGLKQDIAIVETQNVEARRVQRRRAPSIGSNRIRVEVLTTVEFDNQASFNACEVSEVAVDRMLSTKLPTVELAISQVTPKLLFGIG